MNAASVEGLRVLHADALLLVADKPAGLLAVPGRGESKQDCLAARLQAAYPDALVVHRLDQATSGLMLFARGLAAQRCMSSAFAHREVHKRYVAVVAGSLAPATGCIALPLAADWPNRPRQIVDLAAGKPAVTQWRVLGFDAASDTTRVLLQPLTGRTHQLRVHLQALGHPIVGDALYAPAASPSTRLLLHASELEFAHPGSGQTLRLSSPAPF